LLDKIKREFGSRENAIERAFRSNESFRALCREYVACGRALAGYRESSSKEACLREAEYAELLQELAVEIDTRLNALGSVPDLRRRRRPESEESHMTESNGSFAHEER
jgi:hypothetical protein